MKKIWLMLILVTFLSPSIQAGEERSFYLKVNGGGNWLDNIPVKGRSGELKSKIAPIVIVGGGFSFMEDFRTDITYEKVSDPKLKGVILPKKNLSSPAYWYFFSDIELIESYTINAVVKPLHAIMLNIYIDSPPQVKGLTYYAGAGVGISQLNIEALIIKNYKNGQKVKIENKAKLGIDIAYQLTIGAALPIFKGLISEVAYSFRSYGKPEDGQLSQIPRLNSHNLLVGLRFAF